VFIFFVIDLMVSLILIEFIPLMVSIDFVLRTCAQCTVVKVVKVVKISNHLGSRNGLIHFTLILMGKIVSVYEHFGLRTTFRKELSS